MLVDGMSLFQRNECVMARLAADYPSDVASPRCVLGKHHVASSKTTNRAVAGFDLDLTGKSNDVLPPRRGMIIAQMGCRRATKQDSMGRLQLGNFHLSTKVKFNIDFFEMGLVIGSSVKSDDLHEPGCRRIKREKQGNEVCSSRSSRHSFQTFAPGTERKVKPEGRKNLCASGPRFRGFTVAGKIAYKSLSNALVVRVEINRSHSHE